MKRNHEVRVQVSDAELASLDEHRGGVSRSAYVRAQLRELPDRDHIASYEEVLALLSAQARSGSVTAAVALLRVLPDEDEPGDFDDELAELLSDD